MKSTILYLLIASISFTGNCQKKYFGGSDIFRFDFKGSRAINRKTDEITIGLTSLDLTKTSGLFKSDSEAGVLIRTKVTGFDKSKISQSITVERMYLVSVKNYKSGSISLPIEGSVLESFPLTNNGITYSNIELEIILLKKRKESDFGFVVRNIAKLTDELPFPVNPFDPAVSKLAGSIGDMISPNNDEENAIAERIPTATISMSFAPSSFLSQKTGIFAIIFGNDSDEPGFVKIDETNNYEWKIDYTPKRVILVRKKGTNEYFELQNDNLLFYVDAYSTNSDVDATVATAIDLGGDDVLDTTTDKGEHGIIKSNSSTILSKLYSTSWNTQLTPNFLKKMINKIEYYSKDVEPLDYSTTDSTYVESDNLLIFDYIKAVERREILNLDYEKNSLPAPIKFIRED